MQSALFDTSVYISALRRGGDPVVSARWLSRNEPLWLSAVVLQELYAGAGELGDPLLEKLERDFGRIRRILVPNLSDWTRVGDLLARLAAKYGYEKIGRGRLTNDALIAMSAGRLGIRVITANERDFRRLAEFHPFEWQVASR